MRLAHSSPKTTLAIVLGASAWPEFLDFSGSEAFANAARDFKAYLLDPQFFGLPQEHLLDLFDTDDDPLQIHKRVSHFLDTSIAMKERGLTDLLFYFVGHAAFVGNDAEYYLAVRCTSSEHQEVSGIRVEPFIKVITQKAINLRRIFILDCCFAAAAYKVFQSARPADIAIRQTINILQQQVKLIGAGAALLCSSGKDTPSRLASDGSYPLFSRAFIQVLKRGNPRLSQQSYLSLRDVADLTEEVVRSFGEYAPRPEVHSPDQKNGDVATNPFFPSRTMGFRGATGSDASFGYRMAVEKAWTDKKLDGQQLQHLLEVQFAEGLTQDEAESIEREVMGDTKIEILTKQAVSQNAAKSAIRENNFQAYSLRTAAERQQIEADARDSVNRAMIKAATGMMKANDDNFQALDQIVAGA